MPRTKSLEVSGTHLILFPEKAAFWEKEKTLLVADVHLGKDATFRARAVPIPFGSTASDLERLGRLVDETGAERLLVLGDLYHAEDGMNRQTRDALQTWRNQYRGLEVVLVRGNHDRDAGPSPFDLGFTEREGPLAEDPFVFQHKPGDSEAGYVVAGHLHPGVIVRGAGGQRERLPCFHATPAHLVLPALSEFTGTYAITPAPADRVVAVAGDALLSVPRDLMTSS